MEKIRDKSRASRTWIVTTCIFLILISVVLAVVSSKISYVDDAWITFRYAANLAQHGELTYNAGERVEGISNLLWALLLAGLNWISGLQIPLVAAIASVVLIAAAMIRLWRIGILLELNPFAALIPSVLLILTPDFFKAATNGLEIPLFLFLMLETFYALLKKRYTTTFVFLGLLFLTRIESIGIGIFLAAFLMFANKKDQRGHLVRGISVYLGMITVVTVFRILYYQDFIPNSVRDKQIPITSGLILSGVRYLLDFFVQNPVLTLVFFAALALWFFKLYQKMQVHQVREFFADQKFQLLTIGLAVLVFSFVVIARNGGDWMSNFRLVLLYGGAFGCLAAVLLEKKWIHLLVGVALLAGPVIHCADQALYRFRHENDFALAEFSAGMPFWGEAVSRLSADLVPADVVSAEAIGYIGYNLLDTAIHDPLGLTDRTIAREGAPAVPFGKTDIAYTVTQVNPAVMVWHYTGHLDDQNLPQLDQDYTTFCYQECGSWNADTVMIRNDRLKDFADKFEDWQIITLVELQ